MEDSIKINKVLIRNLQMEDYEQLGSLTVRGEIFFENNWLTIW